MNHLLVSSLDVGDAEWDSFPCLMRFLNHSQPKIGLRSGWDTNEFTGVLVKVGHDTTRRHIIQTHEGKRGQRPHGCRLFHPNKYSTKDDLG